MKAMHRVRYWVGRGDVFQSFSPQSECVNSENSLALSTRNFYGGSIQAWLIESLVIRSVSSPSPLPTDGLKVALSCQVVPLGPSPILKISHESAPQHAQRTPTTQRRLMFLVLYVRSMRQRHKCTLYYHTWGQVQMCHLFIIAQWTQPFLILRGFQLSHKMSTHIRSQHLSSVVPVLEQQWTYQVTGTKNKQINKQHDMLISL